MSQTLPSRFALSDSSPASTTWLSRWLWLLAIVAIWLFGWCAILQQHNLLWQRLPPQLLERFVADRVDANLPPLPNAAVLKMVCAKPVSTWVQWRRAWLRTELAECLNAPDGLLQGAAAQQAIDYFNGLLDQQEHAAKTWLERHDAQAPAIRQGLQAELTTL